MIRQICKNLVKVPQFLHNVKFASRAANQELICSKLNGSDEGITVMAMNRPNQKNSFSMNLVQEISNAVDEIAADNSVRTLIVRSLVPGVFCAGKK